jgi:iron complex transport system substrate-binding protein
VRIIAFEPFAVDILARFGAEWELVGISHRVDASSKASQAVVLTRPQQQAGAIGDDERRLAEGLTRDALDVSTLKRLAPNVVVADVGEADKSEFISWAESYLLREVGSAVKVQDVSVNSLEAVYRVIEDLGALVGNAVDARALASNIEAQLMQWADSFFDRCRGKQVVVLSHVEPIVVEGRWFPDLIRMLGGAAMQRAPGLLGLPVTWSELVAARVDVIVVAPEGASLTQSVKTLPVLQALPGWDDIPAVKRGEVIFAPGIDLYRPGPRFLKGAAILVSAAAGLDSGYITERDEYVKVRYLELHRHRFL